MASPPVSEHLAMSLRTPGEVAIKTVTIHLFAVGNYAYMSTLQQRPTRTSLHALRVLLFTFVPTLIIIELGTSSLQSLIQFVKSQNDEEEKNAWFHLSAAVGVCASIPTTNQTTKKEEIEKVPLLKLDPTTTERVRIGWSWASAGKLLVTIFALTQGVGSIVMYARRLDHNALGFDHRNGTMGIASTICSVCSIFVLLLRFDWSVGRALQPTTTQTLRASTTTLIVHTFLAVGLHHVIEYAIDWRNEWLYTSTGVVLLLCGFFNGGGHLLPGWQNIVMLILVYIFRKEIASKIGIHSSRYQNWIRHRSWLRIKTLLRVCLVTWLLIDIGKLFVENIINVVDMRDYEGYWWLDPISDKIFVI